MKKYMLVVLVASFVLATQAQNKAIAVLQGPGGVSNVSGVIYLEETDAGISISGQIQGLTPGEHGFHVHAKGDISGGCGTTGSHFNPFGKEHGGISSEVRHVGDLGNIVAGSNGIANVSIVDDLISFRGETNILGRAFVVHEKRDNLGVVRDGESLKTGNAGVRLACGVIGIFSDDWKTGGTSQVRSFPFALLLGIVILVISFWW